MSLGLVVYHLCGWWQQKGCTLSCFLGLVVGTLGTARFPFPPWRPFIPPKALHPPEGSVAVSRTRLVFSVVFISCGSRVSFDRISSSFPLRQRAGTVEIICLLKAGPTTVRRASQLWVVSWCADRSCHPRGWPHVSHPGGKVWWRRGHRPGRSAAGPHWSAPVPSHGKLKILAPRSSSWGRASVAAPWGIRF